MPRRTRYEEIADEAVEAAEKAGGTHLDFVLGLKYISTTVTERMELSIEELSEEEREGLRHAVCRAGRGGVSRQGRRRGFETLCSPSTARFAAASALPGH